MKKVEHPYLVKIYELFKDSHKFYIVCELCHGDSLISLIQNEGSLTEIHAVSIMKHILSALDYCHQRGVTHTDLKLENIVFNSSRQEVLKIIDFSISKIFRIEEIIEQSKNKVL